MGVMVRAFGAFGSSSLYVDFPVACHSEPLSELFRKSSVITPLDPKRVRFGFICPSVNDCQVPPMSKVQPACCSCPARAAGNKLKDTRTRKNKKVSRFMGDSLEQDR